MTTTFKFLGILLCFAWVHTATAIDCNVTCPPGYIGGCITTKSGGCYCSCDKASKLAAALLTNLPKGTLDKRTIAMLQRSIEAFDKAVADTKRERIGETELVLARGGTVGQPRDNPE